MFSDHEIVSFLFRQMKKAPHTAAPRLQKQEDRKKHAGKQDRGSFVLDENGDAADDQGNDCPVGKRGADDFHPAVAPNDLCALIHDVLPL